MNWKIDCNCYGPTSIKNIVSSGTTEAATGTSGEAEEETDPSGTKTFSTTKATRTIGWTTETTAPGNQTKS